MDTIIRLFYCWDERDFTFYILLYPRLQEQQQQQQHQQRRLAATYGKGIPSTFTTDAVGGAQYDFHFPVRRQLHPVQPTSVDLLGRAAMESYRFNVLLALLAALCRSRPAVDLPLEHARMQARHVRRSEREVGNACVHVGPHCLVVACSRLLTPEEVVLGVIK